MAIYSLFYARISTFWRCRPLEANHRIDSFPTSNIFERQTTAGEVEHDFQGVQRGYRPRPCGEDPARSGLDRGREDRGAGLPAEVRQDPDGRPPRETGVHGNLRTRDHQAS